MKLIKQLKLTSLILVIAFCANPQITFALDVNVTSDTGTTVTNSVTLGNFTNSATITTSGPGSDGVQNSGTGTITTFTNSGTIIGVDDGIQNDGTITSLINSGRITGTFGVFTSNTATLTTFTNTGTTAGSTYGFLMSGLGSTTNVINSGTISGTINAIRIANSGTVNLTLNKGSVLIGDLHVNNTGTLNITSNVGASKSYAYTTAGDGTITLNDLNNRPAVKGSALAINIGSMEMAGENLYQKTANITDAVDRNVKNNKDTWVEPYYSESTRDSGGDSSQIRQFKNNKQGVNAGFKVENSATPLQVIFNVDQTKNNIDSSEHIINSDSVMIGLTLDLKLRIVQRLYKLFLT